MAQFRDGRTPPGYAGPLVAGARNKGPTLDDEAWVVLTTVGDEAAADQLARTLVDNRLAACVSRVPKVRSYYRWEGQVQQDDEMLLLIKTKRSKYALLESAIKAEHPYDLPEILALPAKAGSAEYLAWIGSETETST